MVGFLCPTSAMLSGTKRKEALDQVEQGFEPGSLFSASAIITRPAIRLQTFVSLSASVRMSAGFVLFRFF